MRDHYFSIVHIVLLCVLCTLVSASKKELDCKVKNATFGPQDDIVATCEFKYVKYVAGKRLMFNTTRKDLNFHDIRVRFVESSLQAIPISAFYYFSQLMILEMNGVGMRNIFPESFARAGNLKALQMFDNKLTSIGAFAFAGAKKLEALDLSSNLLTNLHDQSFAGLGNLKELGLSNNRISIIDEQTFHPLVNLTWLWMDRNELKIISVNLLVNSQQLQGLYLNNNKISALSTVLFDKLPRLEFLFMAHNNCSNSNFINTRIALNANVKKELSLCFKEFRTIVPDEEEKFRLKNILNDAEKANKLCEADKSKLLERLENANQQLSNLKYKNQDKNGK